MDKSLACVTRLGKNLGRGQNCLVRPGSCRAAVTSPTPHFPLHVYSFPHRSPWGVGTLLSCEGLVCGFACGCGGVRGALHSVCLSGGAGGRRTAGLQRRLLPLDIRASTPHRDRAINQEIGPGGPCSPVRKAGQQSLMTSPMVHFQAFIEHLLCACIVPSPEVSA